MSKYVGEDIARDFATNGTLIGETEPTRETKGSWWEVYEKDGSIVACVVTDWGVSCGERIHAREMHMYCDDRDAALAKLISINAAALESEADDA